MVTIIEGYKHFLVVFNCLFFTPAMVTLEVKISFYYVITRIFGTLEEARASNSKCHLDDVITEIYSEFSENIDDTNAVNKNTNLIPRWLSSEKTIDKIDHVLRSDLSIKMNLCKSRLVVSPIFAPRF